jgi:hypothetical protein
VSIGRLHGGELPKEIEGFKAFVKAFRTPTFFDAIRGARQVGEIARYNMPRASDGASTDSSVSTVA